MFRKGGSANSGIMDGLDRKGYVDGTNWEDIAASQMRGYPIYGNWGQQETKPITFKDFQESFKGGGVNQNIMDVLIEQEVGSEGDVIGVPFRDFKPPKIKTELETALEKDREVKRKKLSKPLSLLLVYLKDLLFQMKWKDLYR